MKFKHIFLAGIVALLASGCSKFLDRPALTVETDGTAWTGEDNVRLYANQFYPTFFLGYGTNFSSGEVPLLGFQHSDDIVSLGNQSNFTRAVPTSGSWSYTTVRGINILLDRLENRMQNILEPEAYNHWTGIGRFFRAFRYSQLVTQYGDIPYFDHVPSDIDLDNLYKPRTPRNEVMDAVYDDLKFAMENVRLNDGDQNVNRYIVAGFASRFALYEGTWQKYYYKNNERAKKFLDLAVEASNLVIQSGRYDIVTDFRSLFNSQDLKGNRDVLLYRHYDAAVGVTHSIASNSNLNESLLIGPSTDLIKSFIATDGKVWQNSEEENAKNFEIEELIKTRDSRFEASFHRNPLRTNRGSLLYIVKFLPRDVEAIVEAGNAPPEAFSGSRNTTDYPVLRYAEVLLNWIEAKAELETLGSGAVSQADLDMSVNKIRNRPLAPQAISRGVEKTAPLNLGDLPQDPGRDPQVSSLLWEIRRERRMEFTFEYSRFGDLKRWHKLEYMDTDANPDLLSGAWVNFPAQLPGLINNDLSVVTLEGQVKAYNGTNANEMRGFYRHVSNRGRLPFLNQSNINPYLSPISKNDIDFYRSRGYEIEQTEGWPEN